MKIKKNNKMSGREKNIAISSYILLAFPLIGFMVFNLYPIIWAAAKGFFYYDGTKSSQAYVGFENFKTLFSDATYWNTWLTTIKFAIYKLPVEIPLTMLLALLLNKKLKGSGFFRSIYYMPCIISVAVVGIVFTSMFDYFGLINSMLMKANIISENIEWFSSGTTALTALISGSIWTTFGINVMYILAALQNVPEELYESAYLEGAGKTTVFFKITLPLIMPVMQIILLLAINGSLQTCDYILTTTNGAPGGQTYTVMAYLVSKFVPGFAGAKINIGYGCAASTITAVIFAIVAFAYMKLSNKISNIY